MNLYKKSQGNVLIIVLVILMVLAGVVIIWNIVYPMVSQKSAEADTSLFSINLNIKEVILSETGASRVTVERKSGEGEINSIKFIFYDKDGQSYSISKDTNMPKELETKTYYFSPPPDIKKLQSVSVVPVVNNRLGMEYKFNSRLISSFPPGLVSWWRFEDNKDLAGRNNGINSVNINNGNLILDGTNYMSVGNDNSLSMNSEFAISAWIKADAYGGKIISKGANYEVSINPDGKIRFDYGNKYIESTGSIELGKWQQTGVSLGTGALKIFINGNPESSIPEASLIINNEPALIGQGFNGAIDDIMLFNKILGKENIEFLYNNQLD